MHEDQRIIAERSPPFASSL